MMMTSHVRAYQKTNFWFLRSFVCFNSSKTTGYTNMKHGTFKSPSRGEGHRRFDDVTIRLKSNISFQKLLFSWRKAILSLSKSQHSTWQFQTNFTFLQSMIKS